LTADEPQRRMEAGGVADREQLLGVGHVDKGRVVGS
jgi:hypothetical protein